MRSKFRIAVMIAIMVLCGGCVVDGPPVVEVYRRPIFYPPPPPFYWSPPPAVWVVGPRFYSGPIHHFHHGPVPRPHRR